MDTLVELAEWCERESRNIFPERMRDGHSYHRTAYLLDKVAAALRARASEEKK